MDEQGYAETIATILQDGVLMTSVDVIRYNPVDYGAEDRRDKRIQN